jgi:hypothetical protein
MMKVKNKDMRNYILENSEKHIRGLKQVYKCYLNGKFYGSGNLKYMHELFKDYVINCKMYGREECEFKIIKCEVIE